jgi:long-chain acyl-CoA synthetase
MSAIVPFETLSNLFLNLSSKYKGSDKTVFAAKPASHEAYQPIYWDEVAEKAHNIASWLLDNGIKKGERVSLLSENRIEWVIVDMALQLIGAVNVSIYTTLPAAGVAGILKHSEATILFVSSGIQLKKAHEIFEDCPDLTQIIAFDYPRIETYLQKPCISLFDSALEKGRRLYPEKANIIKKLSEEVLPEDLATIIYTSGTTGKPKGVMLTHGNIVSNIKAVLEYVDIHEADRCLSFLPICHAFERTAGYYAVLAGGAEIYYAESVNTVAKNLPEARPTILISVPRLFVKIYNQVQRKIGKSKMKQLIFDWAIRAGKKYNDESLGFPGLQKKLADKLIFNELHEKMGGRIRYLFSGGGALPLKINNFFKAAGFIILEGYGLTETSPIISAPKDGASQPGMVGNILKEITVGIQRLDDHVLINQVSGEDYPTNESSGEGEILCKGPNVMKGYWKDEQATRQKIDDDGWLHSGDVGRFTNGCLQITDRLKYMIVNAGGKNIYPGPIEELFSTSQWIEHIIVIGEDRDYMTALITPDYDRLELWAEEQDVHYDQKEELARLEKIQSIFKKEVKKYSDALASYEKIRDFRLIQEEFSIETGELTPTLKVKRQVVKNKFRGLIEDMYA